MQKASSDSGLIFWVLALVSALIFDPLSHRNGSSASTGRRELESISHSVPLPISEYADPIIYSLNWFCIFIVPYSGPSFFQSFPKCKQMLFSCSFLFLSAVTYQSFTSLHPLRSKWLEYATQHHLHLSSGPLHKCLKPTSNFIPFCTQISVRPSSQVLVLSILAHSAFNCFCEEPFKAQIFVQIAWSLHLCVCMCVCLKKLSLQQE